MKLTEVEFWENYWSKVKIPDEVNLDFSFERCLANALSENLADLDGEVLEVGCAPGRWLAFMAKEFGLKPSGVEYSKAGLDATVKNFDCLGILPGEIFQGDFFEIEPVRKFDVVMSFGFIEHFDNPDDVVGRHLKWLKPGGTLILGVPNLRGIFSSVQKVLDTSVLDKHNLDMMTPDYFSALAKRFELTPIFNDYIGSFEPSLPIPKPGPGTFAQFLVRCLLKAASVVRKVRFFDKVNHPSFSSYILAIYRS